MRVTPTTRPDDRAGALLTVDLAALTENWRILKRQVTDPACDVGAVVKADAYGVGAEPVARALKDAGCKTFFVAHLDEALVVRAAVGSEPRIVVMHGPNKGTERDFAAFRVIPVLNSPEQIARWRGFAEANDVLMESIVHIDTGMNRLGVTAREFEALMSDPDGLTGLHPLALMSHLACAEEKDNPCNDEQQRKFASALATFRGKFPDAKGSFTNSSGIFLGPSYHYQIARPGVALYGANPLLGKNPMIPVVRLKAKVLQVRRVDAAAPVGYGATYTARDGAKLATCSIGYADGLLRSFSNRGHGFIDDIKVPVAGRVSMDLTIFDVSAVPDSSLGPDACIEILGSRQTVDDVATEAGTIAYEVLTSLGPRYARSYLNAPRTERP